MTRCFPILGYVGAMGTILFLSAGQLDLPWFWAFLAMHGVLLSIQQTTLHNDLRRERARPGHGGCDRGLRRVSMPPYVGHLVVAGLDVGRFDWSGSWPATAHGLGLAVYTFGMGLAVWSMSVNRFFSPVARIQHERDHRLITAGPYQYIRHPGYAGGLLAMLGSGIALGSGWSLVPLLPVALLTLRRTVLEDQLLQSELDGYGLYAELVPRRLVPGVW